MNTKNKKTIVIALGGNSILRGNEKGTAEEQYANLNQTAEQLLGVLTSDSRIVITHGNGPQVGDLLIAYDAAKHITPPMPLDVCGAETQGYMGYMIQNTLANLLRQANAPHNITTVISQVVVDANDPAFKNPTKPVGPFYDLVKKEQIQKEKGWVMVEDSSRGYRRVVPSPMPISIQQSRIINSMLDSNEIVIAVGGGGIPCIREANRNLKGIEAVIDKDYASARLAVEIDADIFFILTAVEYVYRNYAKPDQQVLKEISIADAKKIEAEGQFGKGSMEPKIKAAIMFLEGVSKDPSRKREVIITLPETAHKALQGKTGTRIVR